MGRILHTPRLLPQDLRTVCETGPLIILSQSHASDPATGSWLISCVRPIIGSSEYHSMVRFVGRYLFIFVQKICKFLIIPLFRLHKNAQLLNRRMIDRCSSHHMHNQIYKVFMGQVLAHILEFAKIVCIYAGFFSSSITCQFLFADEDLSKTFRNSCFKS